MLKRKTIEKIIENNNGVVDPIEYDKASYYFTIDNLECCLEYFDNFFRIRVCEELFDWDLTELQNLCNKLNKIIEDLKKLLTISQ